MQTTSHLSSPVLLVIFTSPSLVFHPFSSKTATALRPRISWHRSDARVMACYDEVHDQNHYYLSGHGHGNGRLVDENMIVLRKRIHEMTMAERNYEPPDDWMEWEKRYYTGYDSLICEAMGVLQSRLMNTRPSLAFLMVGLISLSLPTSAALVLHQLVAAMSQVGLCLSGIHQ